VAVAAIMAVAVAAAIMAVAAAAAIMAVAAAIMSEEALTGRLEYSRVRVRVKVRVLC
jgi:hypothetical protein